MKEKNHSFKIKDILLLLGMILPLAAGIVIQVLTTPASDGIEITGARIFFRLRLPVQDLLITESQVNSWLVMISILFLCLFLTHGLKEKAEKKRQLIAEWIVEKTDDLVQKNMGSYFAGFSPFIGAMLALSAFSSLLSLLGLFPPTSDLNIVAGWALLVFLLISYYKMKCGPLHYLKSFTEPVSFLTPLNVISEIATPISMAFRHYGNVMSGAVVSTLVASALQGLSLLLLRWLPGALAKFPLFQIGLPAVLSVYFDLFSGCLQAFIFAMLTMLYISGSFSPDEYNAYKARKKRTVTQAKGGC